MSDKNYAGDWIWPLPQPKPNPMFQEAPPIPYDRQPSYLVLTLEVIMRRDAAMKQQFHHTFECRSPCGRVGAEHDTISCLCGRHTAFLARKYRSSLCHVCDCGTWHTILWRGEKSLEERMEDRDIRLEMAGVNPFTVNGPGWLKSIFGKTKIKS